MRPDDPAVTAPTMSAASMNPLLRSDATSVRMIRAG
jgi:hypothetical protein